MSLESLEVLRGSFCQIVILFQILEPNRNFILELDLVTSCELFAKHGSGGPVRGLLGVSGGPKNWLWTSSDLGHSYDSFHPSPGVSLPVSSLGAQWPSESSKALKKISRYTFTPGFPDLNSTLAGISLQTWCIWFKMSKFCLMSQVLSNKSEGPLGDSEFTLM